MLDPGFTLAKKQTLLLLIRHPFKFKTKLNLDFFLIRKFPIFLVTKIRKFQKKKKKNKKKKKKKKVGLLFFFFFFLIFLFFF